MNDENEEQQQRAESNIELAYQYTKNLITERNRDIDGLNTNLGLFLGLGGLILRFGGSLDDTCPSYLFTKALVSVLSVVSIICCGVGLLARDTGGVVTPKKLMSDDLFTEETIRNKALIINTWVIFEEDLVKLNRKKSHYLNSAIASLVVAIILYSANVILFSIFQSCSGT